MYFLPLGKGVVPFAKLRKRPQILRDMNSPDRQSQCMNEYSSDQHFANNGGKIVSSEFRHIGIRPNALDMRFVGRTRQ